MAVKYLPDTNILSPLLGAKLNQSLKRSLRQHADEVATAATVWFELWFGCWRLPASTRRDQLERGVLSLFDSRMSVLPDDESAASHHASMAIELKRPGRPAPYVDGQISGIALSQQLVLVTDNVKHIQHFPGLTVENWLRS